MAKNIFIALEGIDGSGKSTQAKLLAEKLEHAGHKVYATFEPTKGIVGTLLRDILTGKVRADEKTIAGLFLADRLDHLLNAETGIVKKMHEGYTVVTDRYYFSSYAYHGTHMDMDWVIASNKMCADILRPDLNLFIDVSPEVCMQRINANRQSTELYETLENLTSVREKYMEAFEKLRKDEHVWMIDGNQNAATVAATIWQRLETGLLQKKAH
jgi:dTMP kinase